MTQKQADFQLLRTAVKLIKNKEYLTTGGLNNILSIRAAMNKGLSKELEDSFPLVRSKDRPLIVTTEIPDPNWISGFSSGESCFDVKLNKSKVYTTGYQVQIRFRITQHTRDRALLDLIISYLNCGRLQPTRNMVSFV